MEYNEPMRIWVTVLLIVVGCSQTRRTPFDAGATDSGEGEDADVESPDADRDDADAPAGDADCGDCSDADADTEEVPVEVVESGVTWTTEIALETPVMPYQRTRVAVTSEGVPWIVHQLCESRDCDEQELVATYRASTDWESETITPISYTYGYDFALRDDSPVVAFAENLEPTVLTRNDDGWSAEVVDIRRTGGVSLHSIEGALHLLFTNRGTWWSVLEEEGWRDFVLVRDDVVAHTFGAETHVPWGDENLVVNADLSPGSFAVTAFDPATETWAARPGIPTGWDHRGVSACAYDEQICVVGRHDHHLAMVCGLDTVWDSHPVPREQVFGEAVARVLPDGTLAIAYDHWSHEQARLLTLEAGADLWQIETIWDGPGYGIALASDADGGLVASFIGCHTDELGETCSVVYAARDE